MNAEGGSARIFRSLLKNRPARVVVHGRHKPPESHFNEVFVPDRPGFGRLENTRFWGLLQVAHAMRWPVSKRQIHALLDNWNPALVHSHIHGTGFAHALSWCLRRGVPHVASFHDDIRHLAMGDPFFSWWEYLTSLAWRKSSRRYVISTEMGKVYEQRYGAASWEVLTDGLDAFAEVPRPHPENRLHVYFAGCVNVPYEPNFLALQQALKIIKNCHPDWSVRFILRGGREISGGDPSAPGFELRPFASQAELLQDFDDVDVLYLPLSIDPRYRNFARFSLSTKLVTYLGSGLPIFYHGPHEAAARRLLGGANAAICCNTLNPKEIADCLMRMPRERFGMVQNALALGKRDFRVEEMRHRFFESLDKLAPIA